MPTPANDEVARFRQLVGARLGLSFDEGRLDFLAAVLERRVSANGLRDTSQYLARLPHSNGAERRALALELTVGETYFFRNSAHFEALLSIVGEHARAGRSKLRILSAGCASGEEPYTLAILFAENAARLGPVEIDIVGFDLNAAALSRARAGLYSRWSLRQTEPEIAERYFTREGSSFRLAPSIVSRVSFHERNLIEDDFGFWHSGAFDVVFCRNVTMYFAPDVTRSVISRISRALDPDGHLFLGHAETLRGVSNEFHLCHTHDTFYYRRRSQLPLVMDEAQPCNAGSREPSTAWMDDIQRATDRIARLVAPSESQPPGHSPAPTTDTGDADVMLLRAVLLTNSGDRAEAERVCMRLLELDELNASAHYLVALCREAAGDRAGAADHDRAAVYLDPSFAMAHLHLGLMARQAHEHEQAARSLEQALLLLPAEDPARVVLLGGGFSRDALVKLCRTELALAREAS